MGGIDTLAKLVNMSTALQANKRAQGKFERQQFLESGLPEIVAQGINTEGDLGLDPTNPQGRQDIFQSAGIEEVIPRYIEGALGAGDPGTAAQFMQMQQQGTGTSSPISLLSSKDRSYLLSRFPGAEQDPVIAREALQDRADNWEEYLKGMETYSNAVTESKFRFQGADPKNPNAGYKVYNNKTGEMELYQGDPTTIPAELILMSDADITKWSAFKGMRNQLTDLADVYDPDNVGWLDRIAKETGKYFFDTPEYITMKQNVMQMVRLAYNISGKQLSDAERKYITQAFLPQPGWSEENYKQSVLGLKKFLKREAADWTEAARLGRRYIPGKVDEWARQPAGREYDRDILEQAYTAYRSRGIEFKNEKEEKQAINFWLKVNDYDPDKYLIEGGE
jgi:hypothetical protein